MSFWDRVDVRGDDDCWEWRLRRDPRGYGELTRAGRKRRAYRVAWELENGRSVPDGMMIRHSCDNPPCCNPAHLSVGTHKDNADDMVRRGRGRWAKGERTGAARMSDDLVRECRQLHRQGVAQALLSRRYGISPSAVSRIVNHKTWNHLEE